MFPLWPPLRVVSCVFCGPAREESQRWWETWTVCDSGTDYAEIPPDRNALLVHVKEIKKKIARECVWDREREREGDRERKKEREWFTRIREGGHSYSMSHTFKRELNPPPPPSLQLHISPSHVHTHTHTTREKRERRRERERERERDRSTPLFLREKLFPGQDREKSFSEL